MVSRITLRQASMMFILTTLSPAIRLFPVVCARYGGTAGWLAPIVGAAGLVAVLAVLHGLFKNGQVTNLSEAFNAALGRKIGKALLVVYLLWTLALFSLYVRYYAERLVSSLFTNVNLDFFVIAMLILVFFAARTKLTALARFSEISILIFCVVFAVFFAVLVPTLRLGNVLPVTHHDAPGILRSSLPVVSIWGYITLFFFLDIKNAGDIKKHGRNMVLILALTTALMVFLVVGSLGPDVAQRMSLPFFRASKLIDVMQPFDRFEAVLSSIWVFADFILITAFAFIIMNIIKRLFNLTQARFLSGPVVLFGYAGSFLPVSAFELERFSNSPITHAVNITLCIAIPALALWVGKIRRKV